MSSLSADGLVVGQSGFRAGPFNFSVAAGNVLALVGPNGGGKSTLLRTLAGLQPALAGAVRRPDERSPALLPPPGTLSAPFAASHMVALGRSGRARGMSGLGAADRAAAAQAMAGLGIEALSARPFDRLSSGQQQLVLLARLMVQDAALCLLDEPAAMLDPAQTMNVTEAIRGLAKGGRIVVVATHDIGFAGHCDAVLTVGADILFGPPRDVLTPARLSALYGAPLGSCPCCGQLAAGTSAA